MADSHILDSPFQSLSEGDYHARLAHTLGDSVVLFTHGSCSTCRVWKRLLPEALSMTIEHFYEVDVALDTGVARYFDIFHLPSIYLYRDGQFHAELQTEARIDSIQLAVLQLFNSAAQEEP